ncbi:MAG TPA: AAA family ATPase [Streptosporangiaceae bacterium]|nr:AAA family ATPase [Streptosporangiaceae bacterium]
MAAQDGEAVPELPESPSQTVIPAQLTFTVAEFTGRAGELARLDALLGEERAASAAVPVAIISGAPGIGKSTLAVHWAHRVASRFPDGQLYLNLRGFGPAGQPVTPVEAIRGFLDAFEIPPTRTPSTLEAQAGLFRSLLAGKRSSWCSTTPPT